MLLSGTDGRPRIAEAHSPGSVKNINGAVGRKRVVIHYHPKKTFGARLLNGLIDDTGWTAEVTSSDLKLIGEEVKDGRLAVRCPCGRGVIPGLGMG